MRTTIFLLMVYLGFAPALALPATIWEQDMQDAARAYEKGDYGEAERLWSQALEKAEKFGTRDRQIGRAHV